VTTMQPTTPPPKPAPATPPPAKRRMSLRSLLWIALLLAFAFALGWGPQEWRKRNLAERLDETALELRLARLHGQLGVASHEAMRNNFAEASVAARAFFDGCIATEHEFDLSERPRTRLALSAYSRQSDLVLGELSLGDPVVKQRLASLYLTMAGVIERKQ